MQSIGLGVPVILQGQLQIVSEPQKGPECLARAVGSYRPEWEIAAVLFGCFFRGFIKSGILVDARFIRCYLCLNGNGEAT